MHSHIGSHTTVETLQRKARRCNANHFRFQYEFVEGERICIDCDGRTHIWKDDECYDRLWVGVQGKESLCMVTLKEVMDMARLRSFYQEHCSDTQIMYAYAQAIISEVECIPYDCVLAHPFEKPFAVVSVIPYTVREGEGSSHEGSSVEYAKENAIEFLKDKMKSDLTFTFDETVQTAISAFQHLCGKVLNAEDIWVSTARNIDGGADPMSLPKINEYLDIISGASSGEGRPPKVGRSYPSMPSGTPNGRGWSEGVTPRNKLDNVNKHIPLSRGGGCSSSDDDGDEYKKRVRLSRKKT